MATSDTRLGLRLFEFETGVHENVDATNSAELVDYDASRTAGRAARVAMILRGQDVIEDEQNLKKLLAYGLGISPNDYRAVKRFLQDADLLDERETKLGKRVLVEKIERIDHADNYRRLGSLWVSKTDKTEKEEALVHTLDVVVERPTALSNLDALGNLTKGERAAVLEVGHNSGVLDVLPQQRLYYSPMLWDVDPHRLSKFLRVCDNSQFSTLLTTLRSKPGTDVTQNDDQIVLQAVSGGIVPTYRVNGNGGVRRYGFAPYTGNLLSTTSEKSILDKARALVSCLRYGAEAATITHIKNGRWILAKLVDPSRGHRVGPHSEAKGQYGMLHAKQIGKIVPAEVPGRYYFQLIPTKDNLRACQIAMELLSDGETLAHKDTVTADFLGTFAVNHPLAEVTVARKKRAARADELAGILDGLQNF